MRTRRSALHSMHLSARQRMIRGALLPVMHQPADSLHPAQQSGGFSAGAVALMHPMQRPSAQVARLRAESQSVAYAVAR